VGVFLLCNFSWGQNSDFADIRIGSLPSFNYNQKLPRNHELNVKLESRQIALQRIPNRYELPTFGEDLYERTDLSFMVSHKLNLNSKLAVGYMIRHLPNNFVHRFTQQFSFVRKYQGFLLSHRIRFEQEGVNMKSLNYRIRWRVSNLLALQGQSLDPKEWYLRTNLELLARSTKHLLHTPLQYELRIIPMLGYQINNNNKLELGIDYRHSRIPGRPQRNDFWIAINWYFSRRGS
jgi:hypothetical protein